MPYLFSRVSQSRINSRNYKIFMVDAISDMLNRIKTAQAAGKETAQVPFSRVVFDIITVLQRKGFLKGVDTKGRKGRKMIEVQLRYKDKIPVIAGIKRISKPGQRHYTAVTKIKAVKNGYGIAILSTSKGIMTDRDARREKVGGEVFCEVW